MVKHTIYVRIWQFSGSGGCLTLALCRLRVPRAVKSLKSAADLDELKLVNEQLQDELRSVRDDFNRAKEKHARHRISGGGE